ncbi:glycosyltransferase family 4 protein [Peribacillus butanolivorans]|uniref:glycosyltransferase family 4 protein n=1 Tax=Peribacillus butanolivorans TaxID=421767 RepID=UPI00365F019C
MKILWLTNIPSPYRVDFFNELGERCDLTVLFERSNSSERDESWLQYKFVSFKGVIMKGLNIGVDKALTFSFIKYIKKNNYDHIVISNPLTPTGIFAIEYLRINKINYSIESDGAIPNYGKSIKEIIKRHVIKGATRYFSTAEIHDQYYINYGANSGEIVRYPFTSLKKEDVAKKPTDQSLKAKYRDMLGMKEKKIILSVGRFIYTKGYDVLLKAAIGFSKEVGVYIVGGHITDEYIKLKNDLGLDNVYFIDYKNKDELKIFFKAADIFVLPTRSDAWGLVINEAMSFGLPVITTNKCVAGLELIEEGKNGYIVPVEDSKALADRILKLLSNMELIEFVGKKNIKKINDYTIEEMAKKHVQTFEEIIRCQSVLK